MKRLLFVSMAAMIATGSFAAVISPSQALERISSTTEGRRLVKAGAEPRLVYTAKDTRGEAAVYVFDRPGNGFMLLSGDDAAMPVLGYADEGSFDVADMPLQLKYWLEEYAAQIEYARSENAPAIQMKDVAMSFPSSWKSVAPMVTSNWDQGAPYNSGTPIVDKKQSPTGCVATAVAQVMNYWQYPDIGTGQITYTWTYIEGNTQKSQQNTMTFSRQNAFDWDYMLDNYVSGKYTADQAEAVANLMKQVGYACQMQYGASQSGTQTEIVPNALMSYFKYGKGIVMEQRLSYTASEWNELCYNQLAIGPVIYAGASSLGGHCFVMDGYDGDGYFHFNWGWGGTCNGFYLLNALNPTEQGTGGYYGGYNTMQGIVANVCPQGVPSATQVQTMSLYGSVKATMSANSNRVTLNYTNGNAVAKFANDGTNIFEAVLGLEFTKRDGSGSPVYVTGSTVGKFPPGTYIDLKNSSSSFSITSAVGDGEYVVRLVCKNGPTSNDWKYLLHDPQDIDYFYLTRLGNSYKVENVATMKFNLVDARITTPLYLNNPFLLELTIENPYDIEITQSVSPSLYKDGKENYSGENRLVTVGPKSTEKVVYSTTVRSLAGASAPSSVKPVDFDLVIKDINYDLEYGTYGTYTMRRSTNNAALKATSISLTGAVEGNGNTYELENLHNIGLEVTLTASGGFVASPITAVITEVSSGAQVYEKEFDDMVYLGSDQTQTIKTQLRYSDIRDWSVYRVGVVYLKNGTTRTSLGSVMFTSTGVREIAAETGNLEMEFVSGRVECASPHGVASIEVFDAKGAKVAAAKVDTLDLAGLSSGLYIVRAADKAGNVKTLKVVK